MTIWPAPAPVCSVDSPGEQLASPASARASPVTSRPERPRAEPRPSAASSRTACTALLALMRPVRDQPAAVTATGPHVTSPACNIPRMLKSWAGWPRWIRWLACAAAALLALEFLWVLFVPLADWLARQDVGSAGEPLHETAVDNARGRLLTLGAGLVAVAAGLHCPEFQPPAA